jgi:hypothetical protein
MQRTDLIDSMLRHDIGLAVSLSIVLALTSLALSQLLGSDGTTHKGGVADAISFVLFIAVVGIAFLLRFRNIRRLVKNLPSTETVLKAEDEYGLWAAQLPKPAILVVTVLGSIGCVGAVVGLLHVLRSGEWAAVPLLIVAAAGSGVVAWYYTQTWRHRAK